MRVACSDFNSMVNNAQSRHVPDEREANVSGSGGKYSEEHYIDWF
jgi:membrane-bound inhibitor of C-type lysozyme